MHSYGESHEEADEHYPSSGIGLVSFFIPACHQPEYNGCEQGGHCIDLGFYGGEPECVAEAVCQGSCNSGSADCDCFRETVFLPCCHSSCEEYYCQIQEEDREGGADRAAGVYCRRSVFGTGKKCEDFCEYLPDRVSGRMAYLQLVGRCYELSAVPERDRRFDCEKVGNSRCCKYCQRCSPVDFPETFLCHECVGFDTKLPWKSFTLISFVKNYGYVICSVSEVCGHVTKFFPVKVLHPVF